MRVERLLQRWQKAGLLDAQAVARILVYEAERPQRPYLLYAIGGLGALCVSVGLLSIIAANWMEIPAEVKLGLAVILLLALGAGIVVSDGRIQAHVDQAKESEAGEASQASWLREILIFLLYGATLAVIGLVAQTYHLGGEPRHALIVWSLVTFPLLCFAQSRFLLAIWLVALQGTFTINILEWLDDRYSGREEELVMGSAVALAPLITLILSVLPLIARKRPQLAAAARSLGASEWLLLSTAMTAAWYQRNHSSIHESTAALCLALLLVFTSPLLYFARKIPEAGARLALRILLILGPAGGLLPFCLQHKKSGLLAALSFIALWGLSGFTALRLGHLGLFNLATGLIAMRILWVYFEVFGSLLSTGLGLFFGGLLTLLLAWFWLRKVRLRREVSHGT